MTTSLNIEKLTKKEKQQLFAVQVFIKKTMDSGDNEHKLKMDEESILKVWNDENTFPWYMHLGTGKQIKTL